MTHSLVRRIIIFLFLALASFPTLAAGYHVELIIFENLTPVADGEILQVARAYPDYSGAIELNDEEGSQFRLLSSGFHKLGGIYNQLKASGHYRPFLHLAWKQPALGDKARDVHIIKADSGATADPGDVLVKIDGMVRVRASQFLHTDVDMLYFPLAMPKSEIRTIATDGNTVAISSGYSRLRESRRMKLNELHYFDHPLFGVIVFISRAGAE